MLSYRYILPNHASIWMNNHRFIDLVTRRKVIRGWDDRCSYIVDVTPLEEAIHNRDKEMVELLLKAGADPNSKDRFETTLLHYAIRLFDTRIVECLLNYGANVNVISYNQSYLHMTARMKYDCSGIIELLVQNGIDTSLLDGNGKTALQVASKNNRRRLKLLLKE